MNGLSGGLLLVSDNFARYHEQQRALCQNVLALRDVSDVRAEEYGGKMALSYTLNGKKHTLEYNNKAAAVNRRNLK